MELPFPTFFMNKYFPQKKGNVSFCARQTENSSFCNAQKYNTLVFQEKRKLLKYFSGKKLDKKTFFQNKIARDFAPVVYPIRSNWILTMFTSLEGSQSELSGNQNFIKIEYDLTGSINAYSKKY